MRWFLDSQKLMVGYVQSHFKIPSFLELCVNIFNVRDLMLALKVCL